MIAIHIAMLVASQGTPPVCEHDVLDALEERRYAIVMDATEAPSECIGEMARWTYRAEAAWSLGDLYAAGLAGRSGLNAYIAQSCAYHRNTALLAFAAGLSAQAGQGRAEYYFYWVADRVHQNVPTLTREQAEVAEYYAAYFGSSTRDDSYVLGSPYLYDPHALNPDCGRIPRMRLPDTPLRDFAVAIFEYRGRSSGQIHAVRQIYAFPQRLPRETVRGFDDLVGFRGNYETRRVFVFDPCMPPLVAGDAEILCLPGHHPQELQADEVEGLESN